MLKRRNPDGTYMTLHEQHVSVGETNALLGDLPAIEVNPPRYNTRTESVYDLIDKGKAALVVSPAENGNEYIELIDILSEKSLN